jgi:hypothetical protein
MPTTPPQTAPASGPVLPEIAASDVEAVRRFLTAGRDENRGGRGRARAHQPVVVPTVRHGITRARLRSAVKPE